MQIRNSRMKNIATLLLLLVITSSVCAQQNDPLDKLANDFWTWRAKYAPFNGDDVPRIERPGGMRDWSRPAIEKRRKDLDGFESRWKKIDAKGWPVPKQVDSAGPVPGNRWRRRHTSSPPRASEPRKPSVWVSAPVRNQTRDEPFGQWPGPSREFRRYQ